MHVEMIDTFERFCEIRSHWDSVYEADPEAHFFLSSTFMNDWLPRLEGPWFILAVRAGGADSACVAFLPLRLRTKERKSGGFYNEINMAGNYVADYTGLICRPEAERAAIPALAKYLMRLHWTHLNLENISASEERLQLLLRHFPERLFVAQEFERINAVDKVDNCICPYAPLPDDWDRYLESLSANTRQKIRRFLRQVEGNPEFRITHPTPETIDRDLKILLRLWSTKWAARKGSRIQTLAASNYATLLRAFRSNVLFLPVLWKGETPLGALASFVDPVKRTFLFYMAGRDETFDGPPPGLVLHGYSIRYAIANGYKRYDFLRGNEPYKYSFGVEERRIKCIRISTRNGRNLGDRLDVRSVDEVLKRSTEQHQAGRLAEAERGYRQILEVSPKDPNVLYRFGQLMATRGKLIAARRAFKDLVAARPDAFKAWLGLAQSLQSLNRFTEAAQAYRQVIRLRPDHALAHRNLGQLLVMLGRHAEASRAFHTALELQPGDRIAESGLALARRIRDPGHNGASVNGTPLRKILNGWDSGEAPSPRPWLH